MGGAGGGCCFFGSVLRFTLGDFNGLKCSKYAKYHGARVASFFCLEIFCQKLSPRKLFLKNWFNCHQILQHTAKIQGPINIENKF